MADTIYYDDSNLQRLFDAMSLKQRAKAMRGAFRKAANRVRRVAVANLRQRLNSSGELEQGIRVVLGRRFVGFRVTAGTKKAGRSGKGGKGYYISRRRRNRPNATGKPVLIWAEDGTDFRYSRKKGARKLHTKGRMKRYGFMKDAESSTRSGVMTNLEDALRKTIIRDAKKYGCS